MTFICLLCFPACTAQLPGRERDKNLHAGRASLSLLGAAIPAPAPRAPSRGSIPAAHGYEHPRLTSYAKLASPCLLRSRFRNAHNLLDAAHNLPPPKSRTACSSPRTRLCHTRVSVTRNSAARLPGWWCWRWCRCEQPASRVLRGLVGVCGAVLGVCTAPQGACLASELCSRKPRRETGEEKKLGSVKQPRHLE